MGRKRTLSTIITVEKSKTGTTIKSNKGFNWKIDKLSPAVAITALLGQTLSNAVYEESWYSGHFIIELKIEHKDDE